MTASTAYSRDLGDELRRLRETCTGLSGNKLAVKLGWDPSKVSTIEHGKARASEIDLAQYLTACGKDIDYYARRSSRACSYRILVRSPARGSTSSNWPRSHWIRSKRATSWRGTSNNDSQHETKYPWDTKNASGDVLAFSSPAWNALIRSLGSR